MFKKCSYPVVRRSSNAYKLHGKLIPDPYDYLEDPSADETKSFVEKQNDLFQKVMESTSDLRAKIKERIMSLRNYARTGNPSLHGGMYYYSYNSGLQNQNVILRTKALDDPPEVFLDPNQMNADGTTAITAMGWSKNGEILAYGLSKKGSDWVTIYVRDAKTNRDLPDTIEWTKFTNPSWWGNDGFFYSRYPPIDKDIDKGTETDTSRDNYVCFHKLGTPQSEDVEILKIPEQPFWGISLQVTDCHRYVVICLRDGCDPKNLIWIAPLPSSVDGLSEPLKFQKVINEFVGFYEYLGNYGHDFYFLTDKDAPLRKVICLSLEDAKQRDVVAERSCLLENVALVKERLLLCYLEDVKTVIYYRALGGTVLQKLDLPIGSLLSLYAEHDQEFVSFKISSFLLPGRSFVMDIRNPEASLKVFKDDLVSGIELDKFHIKQVFYHSTDGTRIPMFIFYGDTLPAPSSPLLVYGYGGFNISITPFFNPDYFIMVQNFGGVLAVANIRGGGEYGEDWHKAGSCANKQNCFTDFIEGIKFLHSDGIGSPNTTVISGASNGGLLVASVANQAPQLLRCVLCNVGVLDMYKFHKFTCGHGWISDYGDPDKEEDFKVLEKYSPLHNIKPNTKYPAIMVTTGDHDDRVVPLHSLKYIATLQYANPAESGPFLARIEVAAGHGFGKPTLKRIEETADVYAFVAKSIGITWHES